MSQLMSQLTSQLMSQLMSQLSTLLPGESPCDPADHVSGHLQPACWSHHLFPLLLGF